MRRFPQSSHEGDGSLPPQPTFQPNSSQESRVEVGWRTGSGIPRPIAVCHVLAGKKLMMEAANDVERITAWKEFVETSPLVTWEPREISEEAPLPSGLPPLALAPPSPHVWGRNRTGFNL